MSPRLWPTLLLLTACPQAPAGADAGALDAAVEVSPVELCQRLSQSRCALLSRCYPAFQREGAEACLQNEQARCLERYDGLRKSFEARRVLVDGPRLASCEARARSSSCPPSLPPAYPLSGVAAPFADCTLEGGLLLGAVASGQACERAVDCAPGTVCIQAGGACRGTCSSWPQEGEACAFGCAPGLFCDGKGTQALDDDRCTTPRELNGPCSSSRECAPRLVCEAGRCRARGKAFERCAFDPDRLSSCDPGLACDVVPFVEGQVGTCVVPQDEGGSCRFHSSCRAGLICADIDFTGFPQQTPGLGFCRAPTPRGGRCLFTAYARFVGDACAAGTVCQELSGTCEAAPGRSEPCAPSSQGCAGVGLYCKPSGGGDLGTCTGPPSVGERCAFRVDAQKVVTIPCSSGWCDGESLESCREASRALGQECSQDGQCQSGRCAVQPDSTLRCAPAC